MPTWRSSRRSAVLVACTALLLAGCGADTGRFDPGSADKISCMEHQSVQPDTSYTDSADSDTAGILTVFRYYVANGSKPYCDGQPPTETDRMWAQLVVDLGGSADSVAPILEGG